MVIVERPHHAVESLQVAYSPKRFDGRDEDYADEADAIAPEELTDAPGVGEDLRGGKEERDDKPEAGDEIFEGDER